MIPGQWLQAGKKKTRFKRFSSDSRLSIIHSVDGKSREFNLVDKNHGKSKTVRGYVQRDIRKGDKPFLIQDGHKEAVRYGRNEIEAASIYLRRGRFGLANSWTFTKVGEWTAITNTAGAKLERRSFRIKEIAPGTEETATGTETKNFFDY